MDYTLTARPVIRLGREAFGAICLGVLIGTASPLGLQVTGLESRLQAIRLAIDAGRFAEAESDAEALVAALEKSEGQESAKAMQANDLLIAALVRNGKGAQARTLTLAQQAVRIREKQRATADHLLADSLRNLGDVLIAAGEYRLATSPLRRALVLRERRADTDLNVAEDLDHLTRALTYVERYEEALADSERALSIKERILNRGDVRIAQTLEIRGWLLQRKGEYARARPDVARAVALRQAAGPAHPEMATAVSLLGEQFRLDGDLLQAKDCSTRALEIAQGALRPDHPDIAEYLRALALLVGDLGDLSRQRALRERALSIAEQSLGPNHPAVAIQLNDLANSFVLQGDYPAARPLYERALRIYEQRLGPNDSSTTTVVYNLGVVNAQLGDYLDARQQLDRAISSWARVFSPEHPFVARALAALADMLSDQGLYVDAEANYLRALAIRERALGKNHRDVARTLTTLATTEARLGRVSRALELSTRAITIWQQSNERETRRAADAIDVHGTLQAYQGDYLAARSSYDRALSILERVVGSSHPSYAAVRTDLAEAFAMDRQTAEAIRNAIAAEDITRGGLRLTLRYLPERQALGYAAKRARGLDVALSVVDVDPTAAAEVLDALIRGRALVLDEMAGRHRGSGGSTTVLEPLWTALTSARQRLANLVVKGPGQQRPEQYLSLVEEARRDKELAERALLEKSASFKAEMDRAEIGLDRVRTSLPSGSALLSLIRFDRTVVTRAQGVIAGSRPESQKRQYPRTTVPSYAAFVMRSGETDPVIVSLGDAAAIDRLVESWRIEAVTGVTRSPASTRTAERSLRRSGARLRQQIWDPIAKHTEGISRLFVVPDGALNLVPLTALPVGESDYLLEKGPVIHYLAAERDLVPVYGDSAPGQGLLAVGAPAFDDTSLFAALAKSPPPRRQMKAPMQQTLAATRADQSAETRPGATSFRGLGSECPSFQSMRFDPLPASGREATDVARLWTDYAIAAAGSEPAAVLSGRVADERTFKRRAPGQRVLHLATHGFFLAGDCVSALDGTRAVGGLVGATAMKAAEVPRAAAQRRPTIGENPLLLSGLAMAGANRRTAARADEDDGVLTAEEVAALNLEGVEWAVLSACDTGLGEIKAGEGVFGLRRAFQVAGAHTVIMSLWSVEDRSAMEWMRALYEGRLRRGLDTADAVREASLAVLHHRRARGQSVHPFYWAGFVASGDWR